MFETVGAAVYAAFARPTDAVAALAHLRALERAGPFTQRFPLLFALGTEPAAPTGAPTSAPG